MPITVTVYTQPNCVQCHYTKQLLDRNRVPYTEVDIDADSGLREQLRDRGFTSMPVVKVDHGKQVEWWNGFKIDKIRGLAVLLR